MKKSAVRVLAIACAVALLDGAFKFLAIHTLPSDSSPLAWPLDLALHKNPGITFDTPLPLVVVIPVTLIICVFLVRLAWRERYTYTNKAIAAAVVVLGAGGNLVDRLANGFTTDYLIFFRLSAVNLSDILIVTGAIALAYYTEHNPQALQSAKK